MIKFFRKIRQRVLTENKVSLYLLYAIGEIMLVVIGILIALQIDEWNEQRKLAAQEDSYLTRLIAENKQDIESYSVLLQEIEVASHSIEAFCGALNNESSTDSLILHSVEQYMTYGSIAPIFNTSRSTFDDLSNTGNLKVITNIDLRDQIVRHYAEIQRVQEVMNIDVDWALSIDIPFYFETNGMKFVPNTAHLFPKQTQKQMADELRKNKLAYINNAATGFWVNEDAKFLLTNFKNQAAELVKQLETELGASRPIK